MNPNPCGEPFNVTHAYNPQYYSYSACPCSSQLVDHEPSCGPYSWPSTNIHIYSYIHNLWQKSNYTTRLHTCAFSGTLFLSRTTISFSGFPLWVVSMSWALNCDVGSIFNPKSPHSTLREHWDRPLSSTSLKPNHLFLMTNEPTRNL
jgi:hypothetical protein